MEMDKQVDYTDGMRIVETDMKKCESCGGTLIFDPETKSLKCEHCGNTVYIDEDNRIRENDIIDGFDKAERWDQSEQVTYKCSNCGAVAVVSSDDEANICPFCGTTHIIKEGSFNGIKPQVVLPFQFGTEKASEYSKKWAKRRIFAPSQFKKSLDAENLHGVYEPCFTFDAKSESFYKGRVGYRRTRTVGSGKNRRTETYVVWKHVSGRYNKFFDDVMVANNKNFNQKALNGMMPFKSEDYCVYTSKYLSGFVAEGYQKDLKGSWEDAKTIMNGSIRDDIKSRLGCDLVDYLNVSTSFFGVTYKYVLLPIYRLNYHYKRKDYGVMINGSTGKIKGKTPISALRVAIAVVIGIAVVVGAGFLWYAVGSHNGNYAINNQIFQYIRQNYTHLI